MKGIELPLDFALFYSDELANLFPVVRSRPLPGFKNDQMDNPSRLGHLFVGVLWEVSIDCDTADLGQR